MQKNLRTKEAARLLQEKGIQVSPETLICWRSRGMGPAYKKVGGRIFYERQDLDRFEQGERVETQESEKLV
jgi:DNA-binding transcriptional MerR regulator